MCLICLGKRISNTKSCELERALDSIKLKDLFSCPYASLLDKSNELHILGIVDIAFNTILFLLTVYLGWLQYKQEGESSDERVFIRIPLVFVSLPQSILTTILYF